mgnify:CR=1 FL=1
MSVFDASSTSRRAPESSLPISRRRLLLGSAGAMASVSLLGLSPLARSEEPKTLPDYVRWKNANDVIVHSANTIETERGAIGSGVVTNSMSVTTCQPPMLILWRTGTLGKSRWKASIRPRP